VGFWSFIKSLSHLLVLKCSIAAVKDSFFFERERQSTTMDDTNITDCSKGTSVSFSPNNDTAMPAVVATDVYTVVDTSIPIRRTSEPAPGISVEHVGVYGYVYQVSYDNGSVGLVSKNIGRTRSSDYEMSMVLSVSDWLQFPSVVASLFDPGHVQGCVTTAHWYSESGAQIYHVDVGEPPRSPVRFLFVNSCINREHMRVCRGGSWDGQQSSPIGRREYNEWFPTAYFVQWCDWQAVQGLFSQVDEAIRGDSCYETYGSIRKSLAYDDPPLGVQIGISAVMRH